MNTEEFHRKLTAILSADVQGYSRLMGEDEESTVRTLTAYRTLMISLIRDHRGHVVDTPGDNLLAKFDSGTDAVRCAVEIQEELRIRNADLPENRRMLFRIGINLGDVIEEGDRIYGDGINVAARIEGLAEGGGICISGFVYGAIKNKLSLSYEFMGEHRVKNIKDPVRVYRIRLEPHASAPIVKARASKAWTWQRVAFPVVVIFFLGAVAYILFDNYHLDRRAIDTEVATRFAELAPPAEEEEALKSIAVLPFTDLSPYSDQGYFVDGLSEELLNCLANINGLRVTSRTSSFAFKNTDKTLNEVAGVLGVEHILEGSVRKSEDALRITAQLIRVEDDSHLWSKTYDRKLENIFAIQEDIAKAVADELKIKLGIGESFKRIGGTDNAGAYELYLLAIGQRNEGTCDANKLALETVDKALALDSEYALAWALKSGIHAPNAHCVQEGLVALEQDAALSAAQRAIGLEPNLVSGYYALSNAKLSSGKFIEAEYAYREAIKLTNESSGSSETSDLPMHYFPVGKTKSVKNILERLRRNDPLNPAISNMNMNALAALGDIQGAEEEIERATMLFGDSWWGNSRLDFIEVVHLETGADIIVHDELSSDPILSIVEAHLDSPKMALEELHRLYNNGVPLVPINPNILSFAAAYFNDPEFALTVAERVARYDPSILNFWFPVMHDVRQLPRFKEFVREIGLVDYWGKFGWPDICQPTDDGDFVCD